MNHLLTFISLLVDYSRIKIPLVSSLRSFPHMFLPDLHENFFSHSEHFVENEKDENHLVQSLVNMASGVEQNSLNIIFSCVILIERGVAFTRRSPTFILLSAVRYLRRFSCTRCSC